MPLVRRTRATFRSAEFGFFGVWVNTRTQTPRFCGLSCSAGLLVLVTTLARPFRTSWLIVGTVEALQSRASARKRKNAADSALRATSRLRRSLAEAHRRNARREGGLIAPGLGSRDKTARHLELT